MNKRGEVKDSVLRALLEGPLSSSEIKRKTGHSEGSVSAAIFTLKQKGILVQDEPRGPYRLVRTPPASAKVKGKAEKVKRSEAALKGWNSRTKKVNGAANGILPHAPVAYVPPPKTRALNESKSAERVRALLEALIVGAMSLDEVASRLEYKSIE